MVSINQWRKKYNDIEKMNLIDKEYIDYEYQLIRKLDKFEKLNPELVEKVYDWYEVRNPKKWRPNWLK